MLIENRIKELDVSIFQMKELIQKTETETNQYMQKQKELVNNTNIAILRNEGRKDELEKLIEDLKNEEGDTGEQ